MSSFLRPGGTALGRASSDTSLSERSSLVSLGQRQGKFMGMALIRLCERLRELSPSNSSSLPSAVSHSIVRLALHTFNRSYKRVWRALAGVMDPPSSVSDEDSVKQESLI